MDADLLPKFRYYCQIGEARLYLAETLREPSYIQRVRANLRGLFGPKNPDAENMTPLEKSIREANPALGPADVLHQVRWDMPTFPALRSGHVTWRSAGQCRLRSCLVA